MGIRIYSQCFVKTLILQRQFQYPVVATDSSEFVPDNGWRHLKSPCNALQHTATHCNALQHIATFYIRQRLATSSCYFNGTRYYWKRASLPFFTRHFCNGRRVLPKHVRYVMCLFTDFILFSPAIFPLSGAKCATLKYCNIMSM